MQVNNPKKSPTIGYVAVGSNLVDAPLTPMDVLQNSLGLLEAESILITGKSKWYASPAFPKGAGPDFVNGVIAISTDLTADLVLSILHHVEEAAGRKRNQRWAARSCDLDLLAFGDVVLPDEIGFKRWAEAPIEQQMSEAPKELVLPHPRIQDRSFVLVPWHDIAPNWRHPVFHKTIAEMLADRPAVERAELSEIVI